MSRSGLAMSPNPSTNNNLLGVSADSATDAWAVGWYLNQSNLQTALILHWNGTAWSKVKSPSMGANGSVLAGVSALSATDAWAVGWQLNSSRTPGQTLILHWNGTAWSKVKSPNPSPVGTYQQNALNAVSADSPTDAWAVGGYNPATSSQSSATLILHWNGTTWTKVKSPNPGATNIKQLTGVTAVSGTDAWTVGWYRNVSATLPTTLILHWNGTTWTKVKSPNPGATSDALAGVTAVSGTDALAVGDYETYPGPSLDLTLTWNGTTWTKVKSPNPGRRSNMLNGVSADSPTDAWAVGVYSQPTTYLPIDTLTLHWTGTTWTRIPSPNPSGSTMGDNELNAVSALSPTDAWAVGDYANTSGGYNTLILHWNGTVWSRT